MRPSSLMSEGIVIFQFRMSNLSAGTAWDTPLLITSAIAAKGIDNSTDAAIRVLLFIIGTLIM
jgi:hypothetical protein